MAALYSVCWYNLYNCGQIVFIKLPCWYFRALSYLLKEANFGTSWHFPTIWQEKCKGNKSNLEFVILDFGEHCQQDTSDHRHAKRVIF